jgi:hypothetical protein
VRPRPGSSKDRSSLQQRSRKAASALAANEILHEARKLHKVSESLDKLAHDHAPVAEALTILAGSVRNSATLLEVLVALRLGP